MMAAGDVYKIFRVVVEIKKAVETAKHNREQVLVIKEYVETVEDILSELHKTGVTEEQWMNRALTNLHKNLQRALKLVEDCQKKNMMCLLCTARDLSNKLLRARDDISANLTQVTLATTVHITKTTGKANAMRRKRRIVRRLRPTCPPPPKKEEPRPPPPPSKKEGREKKEPRPPAPLPKKEEALSFLSRPRPAARPAPREGRGEPRPLPSKMAMPPKVDEELEEMAVVCSTGDTWGGASFEKGKTKVDIGVDDSSTTLSGLKKFSLSELNAATNNFSDDRVIGEGAYSTVYKGVLHDGLIVAVKVLHSDLEDSEMTLLDVLDEIKMFTWCKHKNVVKYLGYCMDVRTHIMVLDYLPNGSLQDIVKGEKRVELSSSFRIIQEIAQGVHYLHKHDIIHADLKAGHILFDTDMSPVIIDFGLSVTAIADDEEFILDSRIGTIGYMAPEMMFSYCLSKKSDVFSFGVCLIRTIITVSTGRCDWYGAKEWDEMVRKTGGLKGLLDPTVKVDEFQLMEINRYLDVGWLCIDMDPAKRPTMADVIQMLSRVKEPPTP